MLVPVPGAAVLEALPGCVVLDGLSRSQDLYHSLGKGSFSITAYSVPGVNHRSAHALTCQQERFVACNIDLCRNCVGAAPALKGMCIHITAQLPEEWLERYCEQEAEHEHLMKGRASWQPLMF